MRMFTSKATSAGNSMDFLAGNPLCHQWGIHVGELGHKSPITDTASKNFTSLKFSSWYSVWSNRPRNDLFLCFVVNVRRLEAGVAKDSLARVKNSRGFKVVVVGASKELTFLGKFIEPLSRPLVGPLWVLPSARWIPEGSFKRYPTETSWPLPAVCQGKKEKKTFFCSWEIPHAFVGQL